MANRRLTASELAQLSPGERAKWYRRHKLTPPGNAGDFPTRPSGEAIEPPAWLSARHKVLFHEVVAAAPPVLLQAVDVPLLAAYVVQLGILEQAAAENTLEAQRLARQTSQSLTACLGLVSDTGAAGKV
jgi:hypothetical protein